MKDDMDATVQDSRKFMKFAFITVIILEILKMV